MKNKATNVLIDLNIPANIKGFRYIIDAMHLFSEDDLWITGKTTGLYKKIAERNKTTDAKVERAIRHAFETAFLKGEKEKIEKYLTFSNRTNGNLLVVLYIRLTEE